MRRINRLILVFSILASSLILAGCLEYSEDIVINADGSGSMTMEVGLSTGMLGMMGGEGGEEGSPFAKMKDAAEEVNSAEHEDGITASATYEERTEGDTTFGTFTVEVSDITRLMEVVDPELWSDSPGAPEESGGPFKLEKVPSGNLAFTKVLEMRGAGDFEEPPETPGFPDGESVDEMPEAEESDESAAVRDNSGILASIGLITPAYAEAEGKAGEEETPDDSWAEFETEDTGGGMEVVDEAQIEDMMLQFFAGKFYTVRVSAPKIVETNGTILGDKMHGDGDEAAPVNENGDGEDGVYEPPHPGLETVEWKIPMGDLFSGKEFFQELKAELSLKRPRGAGGAGGLVKAATSGVLKFAGILLVILLAVGLIVIGVGKSKAKKPEPESKE